MLSEKLISFDKSNYFAEIDFIYKYKPHIHFSFSSHILIDLFNYKTTVDVHFIYMVKTWHSVPPTNFKGWKISNQKCLNFFLKIKFFFFWYTTSSFENKLENQLLHVFTSFSAQNIYIHRQSYLTVVGR